jgi:hypothetical protein
MTSTLGTLGASALNLAVASTLSTTTLALLMSLGVLTVAALSTWLVVRIMFVEYQQAFGAQEAVLMLRLENVGGGVVLVALQIPTSVINALGAIASSLSGNPLLYLGIGALAIGSVAFLNVQPGISNILITAWQCDVQTFLQSWPYPLLNAARAIFNAVWPVVNVGVELMQFWMKQYKIVVACTSPADIGRLIGGVGAAVGDLALAFATWLGTGFVSGRIDVLTALTRLGLAFNSLLEVAGCVCQFLDPVWAFLVAIPQIASLQVAVDCAANVPVRVLQMFWASLGFVFVAPDLAPTVIEANCAVVALGDAAQDVALMFLQMILEILNELGITSTGIMDALPAGVDKTLTNVWHAALRTTASPLRPTGALPGDISVATPIWLLPGSGQDLNMTLGIFQLIQLLSTPWSHILTEPIAALFSVANVTLAAATHLTLPTCDGLIDSPLGLRFLQVGFLADRIRTAADAAAQLLVIFDTNMPEAVSPLLQAWYTLLEAVLEIVFAFIYSVFFPPWLPTGVPLPLCSGCGACPINCSACPAGFTIFEDASC